MNIKDRLFIAAQYLLPHHLLSRAIGLFAESEFSFIKKPLMNLFIRRFGVDLSEAERGTVSEYHNFNDFFTRSLRQGAREIEGSELDWVSPVDGAISEIGRIEKGQLIQAKSRHFNLADLLAGDALTAQHFQDGKFATIYLSPKDYHRIHMPLAGTLVKSTFVPGKLFSVSPLTASVVPNLFARNERLICEFESNHGRFILVLVGAMVVASIETTWSGVVAPFQRRIHQQSFSLNHLQFDKAEEIARFRLGSTVILIAERGALDWNEGIKKGESVKMGQKLN